MSGKMKNVSSSSEKSTLALFDHPDDLISAAKKMRELNIEKVEAYTPFPVHGLDEAMGIKRSWIPWGTLVLGLTGMTLAFLLQVWTSAYNWPINVGGKPLISWPAFVPITFEGTVLVAGVGTGLILILGYILPNVLKPVYDPRLTDDRFGLLVGHDDPNFNQVELERIFKDCDVKETKIVG